MKEVNEFSSKLTIGRLNKDLIEVNKKEKTLSIEEQELINKCAKFINQTVTEYRTKDEFHIKRTGSMKKSISKQKKKIKKKIATASRRRNR